MKSIGIKLADGSFYPLLEEGSPEKKSIDLTTATDGQTKIHVDVYRSDTGTMEGAEYLDTLEMQDLKPHQTGEPTLDLSLDMDENGQLEAQITDSETGVKSGIQVTLASKGAAMPASKANETPFDFDELEGGDAPSEVKPEEAMPNAMPKDESAPLPQDSAGEADVAENEIPAQENAPAQESADDFDLDGLEEIGDEPFDFDAASSGGAASSSIEEPSIENAPKDTTDDVTRDETPAEDASPVTEVSKPQQAAADEPAVDSQEEPEGDEASGDQLPDELSSKLKEIPAAEDEQSGVDVTRAEDEALAEESPTHEVQPEAQSMEEIPPQEDVSDALPEEDFDLGDLSDLNLDDLGGDNLDTSESNDNSEEPPAESLIEESAPSLSEVPPLDETPAAQDVIQDDKGEQITDDALPVAQNADEAAGADDFDLGDLADLEDLNLDDANTAPAVAEDVPQDISTDESDGAQVVGEISSDAFDLGGLGHLGDLGQEGGDESTEQIMVPDPASLNPEIEDIGAPAAAEPEEASPAAEDELPPDEGAASGDATSLEEEQPLEELPAEEGVAGTDDFDLGDLADLSDLNLADASIAPTVTEDAPQDVPQDISTDESDGAQVVGEISSDAFDLGGLEHLGDLGQEGGDESTEQIMVPDPASLNPEIEDIGAPAAAEPEEASPAAEGELPPEASAPSGDATSLEEEQPLEELPAEEGVAGTDEFDLGELEDLSDLNLDDASSAEGTPTELSSEDEAALIDEAQPTEDAFPAPEAVQEADTSDFDLGELNDEPFDFDTAQDPQELTSEDVQAEVIKEEDAPPESDGIPPKEDEDDFGLGAIAAMDLDNLADLSDVTESDATEAELTKEPTEETAEQTNAKEEMPAPDAAAEAESADDFDLPDFDDTGKAASDEFGDFDLPDFDNVSSDGSNALEDTAEDFTLPDFDDDTGGDNLDFSGIFDDNLSGLGDKPSDDLIFSGDDFSLPDDFSTTDESKGDLGGGAGLFNGLDKEGLYDKATLEGGSPSYSENDDVKRKTKAPVVICVICAIICVLAAALILLAELKPDVLRTAFFSKDKTSKMISLIESVKSESSAAKEQESKTAQDTKDSMSTQAIPKEDTAQKSAAELPSSTPPPRAEDTSEVRENSTVKENTAKSSEVSSSDSEQKQAQTETAVQQEAPKPAAVEAKEDQIVVASSPEMVTPQAPEPNPQKAPDVRYKVVWGDTLWDISNAYYRTPWKFRRIASYNGIKDPDKIIAGTWLLIPAE